MRERHAGIQLGLFLFSQKQLWSQSVSCRLRMLLTVSQLLTLQEDVSRQHSLWQYAASITATLQ